LVKPVREAFSSLFELALVLHERAHVRVLVPLGFLHRSTGRGVLGSFDGDAVGGVVLDDVVVNFRREHWLFAGDIESGELVKELGVFRIALADGFQREGRGFKHLKFHTSVEEQLVGLIVEGILLKFLLNQRKRAFRVFLGLSLEFHRAHATGLEAKETAFLLGSTGDLQLALAEQLSRFKETWGLP
jgi:hypothetical protein